jgi:hypothetical protein
LAILTKLIVHPAINGAYTELFAGFSPQISLENSGAWGKWPSLVTALC